MSEQHAEPEGPPEGPTMAEQAGRALIGWLTAEQGQLTLAGRRADVAESPEHVERAREAREVVAAREAGLDQTDAIRDAPPGLDEHVAALEASEGGAPLFAEGQQVRLVELPKLVSIQPAIHSEAADERVAAVDPDDLTSLAEVAIPVPAAAPPALPVQFDETRQTWLISSANPNLRIVGQFRANADQGVIAFGFAVRLMPSFVRVGVFQGRALLLDGYHRSYGFLRRGIEVVPAFVREYGAFEEMQINPGMLLQGAYLGDRPPTLRDFLDDAVAADVRIPAVQRMILIQGLEVTPFG